MPEQDKSKREDGSRPASPPSADPDESGKFRWYEDLLDRILPKKDKRD